MTSKETIEFYSDARYDGHSLLEIWEQQHAYDDIMTPASSLPEYRSFICELVVQYAPEGATILSVGCGNGFVERQLQEAGFDVTASDANKQAVDLARCRGLNVVHLPCERLAELRRKFNVVYCDGVVGHVWRQDIGFAVFANAIRSVLADGGLLLVSADVSRGPEVVQKHPLLEYYLFSADYLFAALTGAVCRGESLPASDRLTTRQYLYSYQRPESGERIRQVVVIKAQSGAFDD